jgi:hypothetical protein
MALAAAALAWRTGSTVGKAASVVGALAIIGAGFNGASTVAVKPLASPDALG